MCMTTDTHCLAFAAFYVNTQQHKTQAREALKASMFQSQSRFRRDLNRVEKVLGIELYERRVLIYHLLYVTKGRKKWSRKNATAKHSAVLEYQHEHTWQFVNV